MISIACNNLLLKGFHFQLIFTQQCKIAVIRQAQPLQRALIRLRLGVCLPFSSRERVIGSQIPSQSCSWVRPRSSRRCLIYSPRKTFFIETTPDWIKSSYNYKGYQANFPVVDSWKSKRNKFIGIQLIVLCYLKVTWYDMFRSASCCYNIVTAMNQTSRAEKERRNRKCIP